MNKYHHSPNGIFLLELLLNILLFSVLLIIGLQFFIKTHTLTQKTSELHYAVTLCGNVASIYESKNNTGSILDVSFQYPYCTNMKNRIFIYYNKDFEECKKEDAAYYILVTAIRQTNIPQLSKARIAFYNSDKKIIYSITACNYQPLTPSHKEVSGP